MPLIKRIRVEATLASEDTGEAATNTLKKPQTDVPLIAGSNTNPTSHIGNPAEGEAGAVIDLEPQGFLRLPFELQEEVLGYLRHTALWTTVGY